MSSNSDASDLYDSRQYIENCGAIIDRYETNRQQLIKKIKKELLVLPIHQWYSVYFSWFKPSYDICRHAENDAYVTRFGRFNDFLEGGDIMSWNVKELDEFYKLLPNVFQKIKENLK